MKDILYFDTLEQVQEESKKRIGVYRSLHTDFIDGRFKVTFVNGDDDPANSPKQIDVEQQRLEELKKKLQDDTITFDELKEYLRSR